MPRSCGIGSAEDSSASICTIGPLDDEITLSDADHDSIHTFWRLLDCDTSKLKVFVSSFLCSDIVLVSLGL